MDATLPAAKSGWMTRLYLKVESYAGTPAAVGALVIVSFVDSSFFPVTPFALLVPMVIAEPKRWWRLVLLGTAASVAGCVLGWGIGLAIRAGVFHLFTIDTQMRIDRFGLHGTVGELLSGNLWTLAALSVFRRARALRRNQGSHLAHRPLPARAIAPGGGRRGGVRAANRALFP